MMYGPGGADDCANAAVEVNNAARHNAARTTCPWPSAVRPSTSASARTRLCGPPPTSRAGVVWPEALRERPPEGAARDRTIRGTPRESLLLPAEAVRAVPLRRAARAGAVVPDSDLPRHLRSARPTWSGCLSPNILVLPLMRAVVPAIPGRCGRRRSPQPGSRPRPPSPSGFRNRARRLRL